MSYKHKLWLFSEYVWFLSINSLSSNCSTGFGRAKNAWVPGGAGWGWGRWKRTETLCRRWWWWGGGGRGGWGRGTPVERPRSVSICPSFSSVLLTHESLASQEGPAVIILSAWQPWNNIGHDFIKIRIKKRNDSVWTARKKSTVILIPFCGVKLLYTIQCLVTFFPQWCSGPQQPRDFTLVARLRIQINFQTCIPWSLIKQCFNSRARSLSYHVNAWLLTQKEL